MLEASQTSQQAAPALPPPTSPGSAGLGSSRANRAIFRYFDGERQRGIDPLLAVRRFADHPTFLVERDYPLATMTPPKDDTPEQRSARMAALANLVAGTRDAFEVQAWHEDENGVEHGLTETECVELFIQFDVFTAELKKNGGPNPTGQPSTVPPDSHLSNLEKSTSDSLACGSIESDPKPAALGTS